MIKYNLKCHNEHEFESWFSSSKEFEKLNKKKLCLNLAQQIVVDGEGAKQFLTVKIIHAKSLASAKNIAFSIANSPLVKTAIAGEDPNWGRIIMGIGKSGEAIDPKKLKVKSQSLQIKLYLIIEFI